MVEQLKTQCIGRDARGPRSRHGRQTGGQADVRRGRHLEGFDRQREPNGGQHDHQVRGIAKGS